MCTDSEDNLQSLFNILARSAPLPTFLGHIIQGIYEPPLEKLAKKTGFPEVKLGGEKK